MSNATQVIDFLPTLDNTGLEQVLKQTLKAIVQLRYRELMEENKKLRTTIEELEADHEEMLQKFSEVEDYQRAVEYWIDEAPSNVDVSDYV